MRWFWKGSLYKLDAEPVSFVGATKSKHSSKIMLWYKRMVHMGERSLKEICVKKQAHGLKDKNFDTIDFYESVSWECTTKYLSLLASIEVRMSLSLYTWTYLGLWRWHPYYHSGTWLPLLMTSPRILGYSSWWRMMKPWRSSRPLLLR